MFFFDKLAGIRSTDRVLEIGPGGTPHPRADVLLELRTDETEAAAQRGHTPALQTRKPLFYYDGADFPFRTREFDYVICAHVLEHVPNLGSFLDEMFRVAQRGYIEYPTIYYEYLHNFAVHLNLLRREGDILYYLPKSELSLDCFRPVQDVFLSALREHAAYSRFIGDMRDWMFEGSEWQAPLTLVHGRSIERVTADPGQWRPSSLGLKERARRIAALMTH